MIDFLHGCSSCGLGQDESAPILDVSGSGDGIDLSSIDFGGSQPIATPILAPIDFPNLDSGTILDTFPIDIVPQPVDVGALPTAVPPADVSAADISLMPTPAPASIPNSSSSSTAADIAAGAAAVGGIFGSLKNLLFGPPAPPPGYTRNAQGQLVPMPMVAGVPQSTGITGALTSAKNFLTASSLLPGAPNWLLLGGGVAAVALLSGGSPRGRRRR